MRKSIWTLPRVFCKQVAPLFVLKQEGAHPFSEIPEKPVTEKPIPSSTPVLSLSLYCGQVVVDTGEGKAVEETVCSTYLLVMIFDNYYLLLCPPSSHTPRAAYLPSLLLPTLLTYTYLCHDRFHKKCFVNLCHSLLLAAVQNHFSQLISK